MKRHDIILGEPVVLPFLSFNSFAGHKLSYGESGCVAIRSR